MGGQRFSPVGPRPTRRFESGSRARRVAGFSLIDVLVSLSVVVVLMSLLAPSLKSAQEAARRVACASNIRQIGLGMQMYAFDHDGHLPPSALVPPNAQIRRTRNPNGLLGDTMFPRVEGQPGRPGIAASSGVWDGLGVLVKQDYLSAPGVFYCPSHHGMHSFEFYAPRWTQEPGFIAGNYQYRLLNSPYLSELAPRTTLIADGMRTKDDYNHIKGNNFLRVDLNVEWYNDVDGTLFASLPDDIDPSSRRTSNTRAWDILDDVDHENDRLRD